LSGFFAVKGCSVFLNYIIITLQFTQSTIMCYSNSSRCYNDGLFVFVPLCLHVAAVA